ncbi:MAG: glycosyltransferase N-terminal domain-containing protein, partial [Pseudomonadota bacterium]
VESELWPNLIWTAQRADIPLALINARMSEISLQGWQSKPTMAASVIGAFSTILAADDPTTQGLSNLIGKDIPNAGSLKLNAPPLDYDLEEHQRLSELIGNRPVWLAASTHEAEEEIFHKLHAAMPDSFMIWLPRHPERGPDIARQLGVAPRSQSGNPGEQAYVMDTLGEMGLALSLSKACVLGGSFHPSLMGHNPLEAARAGVPLITGPYHASFVDLFRDMTHANAVTVTDAQFLQTELQVGLSGALDAQARNAQSFAARRSGTLDRTVQALEALL